MKLINKLTPVCFLFLANMALANNSPVGLWKTIDDESGQPKAIVQITQNAQQKLFGKIIKIYPSPGNDQNEVCKACKGERHNQPIVGMVFMENLIPSPDNANTWSNGQILDPKSGKVYHCNLTVSKNGENLNVRGYIGLPLFGRTQTWIKVDNLNQT